MGNSGHGYSMMGGNTDSVTNQSPFYNVKDEQETAVHGETTVESYASMRMKHKTYTFTLDSAANGNIAPWTDGLERIRDNGGYSSVVRISGGKTPITHIGYLNPIGEVNVVPGAKKGLLSLISLANDGCTFRGDKEQRVVWNRHGKEIIHASRDVEDDGGM